MTLHIACQVKVDNEAVSAPRQIDSMAIGGTGFKTTVSIFLHRRDAQKRGHTDFKTVSAKYRQSKKGNNP